MPQRRPLGEISGNRRDGKELTPIQRAEVVGAAKRGVRYADISRILDIAPTTV
jgi:DNA-directed RNA polymerase specialized sigma24 family protein